MGYSRPDAILERIISNNSPNGPRCRTKGCHGNIIRKPDPDFKGSYLSPECSKCGKVYIFATKVPKLPRK